MTVKMRRSGVDAAEPGWLKQEIQRGDRTFQVVTIIAKHVYQEVEESQRLERVIAACIRGALNFQESTLGNL